jgi:hypothetical protein
MCSSSFEKMDFTWGDGGEGEKEREREKTSSKYEGLQYQVLVRSG